MVECHPFSTGTLFCFFFYLFLSKGKEVAFVVAFAPASAPQSPVTPTAVHHAGACHWRPTSASACRWNLVTVFLPIYFINRFPAVVCLGSTCSTGGGRRGVKCTKSKTKQTSRPKANKRARSLAVVPRVAFAGQLVGCVHFSPALSSFSAGLCLRQSGYARDTLRVWVCFLPDGAGGLIPQGEWSSARRHVA